MKSCLNTDICEAETQQLWREHPIIGVLGDTLCDDLLRRYPAEVIEEGIELTHKGDSVTEISFLLAGAVRQTKSSANGREILAHVLEAPAVLGDAEALQHKAYCRSAKTLESCLIVRIDKSEVSRLLAENHDLSLAWLRYLSELCCLQAYNEVAALGSLEQRIANVLLTYASRYGTEEADGRVLIGVQLSIRAMADSVGAAPRSTGQAMSAMQKAGLIKRRGDLLVIDRQGVEAVAAPVLGGLTYRAGIDLPERRRQPSGELAIVAGSRYFEGQQLPVEEELLIGRESCDLMLPDSAVCPRHARIFRSDTGRYWVQDLDSVGGTIVNGKSVQRAVLRDGDRITLGSTELSFRHVINAQKISVCAAAASL